MAQYDIYSGIVSTGVNLNKDVMHIHSGGIANNTTMLNEASMYVSSGGTANYTMADAAEITVYSGGRVNSTYLGFLGMMVVNGIADNTSIDGHYASLIIDESGIANNTVLRTGMFGVLGSAANTTVSAGGSMMVVSGGVISKTTVNNGGVLAVSESVAKDTYVHQGGIVTFDKGANATNVVADAGAFIFLTVAPDTYVKGTSAGSAFEMKNAYIEGYTVKYGKMDVLSGGSAKNINVVSAELDVMQGAIVKNIDIKSGVMHVAGIAGNINLGSGGVMYVWDTGYAMNTDVCSGATLNIMRGTHLGELHIEKGAVVSATGAKIDFTLVDRKTTDRYLLNDFSLIQGSANFSITVDMNQKNGTYRLADNTGVLSGYITIGNEFVTYGNIYVNGDDFVYDGVTYSLDNANNTLTLTVKGAENPTVDGDIDGNGYADTILVHRNKIRYHMGQSRQCQQQS